MRLLWIEARDFRNYREVALEFPEGLVALVGPNGQGKTNLLEAMYYVCALSSPRVSADLPLVRQEAGPVDESGASAFVRGEAEAGGRRLLIEVEIRSGGQNRVQVNRSAVRRKAELRRQLRAVFSGPDDLGVVQGDPGERRRFMDEAVAGLWPVRAGESPAYERVLRQRNRLLKDWPGPGEPPELGAWDEQLVIHGAAVTALRARAVGAIRDRATAEFGELSGSSETLRVEYRPSVEGEPLEDSFRARLAVRRGDELVRRTTLVGPHRDDLGLSVQGLAARGFASHGEAWGAAIALRLALAGAVAEEAGEPPVLLLDDPFSGLDPERRRRLAGSFGGRGQVVVAVPDEAHVPPGAARYSVREGAVVAA